MLHGARIIIRRPAVTNALAAFAAVIVAGAAPPAVSAVDPVVVDPAVEPAPLPAPPAAPAIDTTARWVGPADGTWFEVASAPDGVDVLVGLTPVGVTPVRFRLPSGQWSLRLWRPGYYEDTHDVRVRDGEEASIRTRLRRLRPRHRIDPEPSDHPLGVSDDAPPWVQRGCRWAPEARRGSRAARAECGLGVAWHPSPALAGALAAGRAYVEVARNLDLRISSLDSGYAEGLARGVMRLRTDAKVPPLPLRRWRDEKSGRLYAQVGGTGDAADDDGSLGWGAGDVVRYGRDDDALDASARLAALVSAVRWHAARRGHARVTAVQTLYLEGGDRMYTDTVGVDVRKTWRRRGARIAVAGRLRDHQSLLGGAHLEIDIEGMVEDEVEVTWKDPDGRKGRVALRDGVIAELEDPPAIALLALRRTLEAVGFVTGGWSPTDSRGGVPIYAVGVTR